MRSTVSTAQSEIVESMRMSEAGNKRKKSRKHQFLNMFNFNQDQRKGESTVLTRNSRASSMVNRSYLLLKLDFIYVNLINDMLLNVKLFQHALSDHIAFEPSPDPGKLLSINVPSPSFHWSNTANAFISFDWKLSQQDPVMIEDQLWLTTSEGIISQTQTCKNHDRPASWRSTRCQQRLDPTIDTTIISK